MFWKSSAVALAVLGLWTTSAPSQDDAKTYRLGDLPTQTEDDTLLVAHRYHGGGGRYHGGGGHYHGGGGHYHGGYYGGHRSYGGYGYVGHNHYRSYYNSYSPYYYGSQFAFSYRPYYYNSYYYTPPVYYYYQPSYQYEYNCPISSSESYTGIVGTYQPATPARTAPARTAPMPRADEVQPPPPPAEEDGGFRYNGGPASPVPLPKTEPLPQRGTPIDPAKGRVVSVPAQPTKFAYPAYGEKTAPATGFAQDRTILLKEDAARAARR